jgi:hypothetical protein
MTSGSQSSSERRLWPLDLLELEILLAFATITFVMLKLEALWTVTLGSLITVAIVDKIVKDDAARKGWERSGEENKEFLKYLCETRKEFIHLAAPIANAKRWECSFDVTILKEITVLCSTLVDGITREQDNLSIHSSLIKGFLPPIVESRKDEYLRSLRRLRIATRNLMLPQNRNERRSELNQFEIARGDAITDRDLLIKALIRALGSKALNPEEHQDLKEVAGFSIKHTESLTEPQDIKP